MSILKLCATIAGLCLATISFAKVNINSANIDELSALKGIGEVKAAAIVEYREEHGDFRSIDEITNVKGIGEGTLAKISDDITLEGETDLSDISQ